LSPDVEAPFGWHESMTVITKNDKSMKGSMAVEEVTFDMRRFVTFEANKKKNKQLNQ